MNCPTCQKAIHPADVSTTLLETRVLIWMNCRACGNSCYTYAENKQFRPILRSHVPTSLRAPLESRPPIRLDFDRASGRFMMGDRELHCGDCLQVKVHDVWIHTRIEHSSDGWYLHGAAGVGNLNGLEVKEEV